MGTLVDDVQCTLVLAAYLSVLQLCWWCMSDCGVGCLVPLLICGRKIFIKTKKGNYFSSHQSTAALISLLHWLTHIANTTTAHSTGTNLHCTSHTKAHEIIINIRPLPVLYPGIQLSELCVCYSDPNCIWSKIDFFIFSVREPRIGTCKISCQLAKWSTSRRSW